MSRNYSLMYLVGISACFLAGSYASEAIVGGQKAEVDQFPYQVSLMDHNYKNGCGGGIIGDQLILTAAHCIVGSNGNYRGIRIFVLTGTNDMRKIDKPAVIAEIVNIYVPDEYDPKSGRIRGDIAVLKLGHSLELSKHDHLKALKFPVDNNETYVGKTARIAGFGWHWVKMENKIEVGGTNDTYLHFTVIEVFNECHKKYLNETDTEKRICAGRKSGNHSQPHGVCIGDSGSPLVNDDGTVIGILSMGLEGCSEKGVGALYTRVSYYMKFIKDAMNYEHKKHHEDIREINIHHC